MKSLYTYPFGTSRLRLPPIAETGPTGLLRHVTPVVFVRRFTTLVGGGTFNTRPIDAAAFSSANITLWRGVNIGTTPVLQFTFEDSVDGATWEEIKDATEIEPSEATPTLVTFDVTKRWLRLSMALTGTDPGSTCWASGFLIDREDVIRRE